MEREDAETVSAVLYEAERDRVLERMIMEANEGYQIEDRTVAHADDIETVQHMLYTMMPVTPLAPTTTTDHERSDTSPNPHKLSSTRTFSTSSRETRGTKDTKNATLLDRVQTLGSGPIKKWMRSRYSWLAALAAALLILISMPATGALADQFLALFRVQQFQPVSIDSQQSAQTLFTALQNIGDVQQQEHNTGGDRQNLTRAEAEKILGYHVLLPDHLPAGVSNTQSISISGGNRVTYTFNATKARAYLAKHGQGSLTVPAALDGASYTITVAPSVSVRYSSCPEKKDTCQQETLFFLQEVSDPSVQSNGNASLTQLRDFLLSLPDLSPSARELLKHLDEKTGTIPVPIPPQASAEQVTIRGTSGLLVRSNAMSMAIWEMQGTIYTLAIGTSDKAQLLDAVNSLA
ncbi:MAG: hypothetical protein PVS3B1_35070 [Ktedonobacteraceae bacterium]